MQKHFAKRVDLAKRRQAKAASVFEKTAKEFEAAAVEHREVYDEIQVQLDLLTQLQTEAMNAGLRATEQAKRVRAVVGI
jgi:hypothetical protein